MPYRKPDAWIEQQIKVRIGEVTPSPRPVVVIGPIYHVVASEDKAKTGQSYGGTSIDVPYPDGFDSNNEVIDNALVKVYVNTGLPYMYTLPNDAYTAGNDSVTIEANLQFDAYLTNEVSCSLPPAGSGYVNQQATYDIDLGSYDSVNDAFSNTGDFDKLVPGQIVLLHDITGGSSAYNIIKSVSGATISFVLNPSLTDGHEYEITVFPTSIMSNVDYNALSDLDAVYLKWYQNGQWTDYLELAAYHTTYQNGNMIYADICYAFADVTSISGNTITYGTLTDGSLGSNNMSNGDFVILIDQNDGIQGVWHLVAHDSNASTLVVDGSLPTGGTYAVVILKNFNASEFRHRCINTDATLSGEVYVFYRSKYTNQAGQVYEFTRGSDLYKQLGEYCSDNPTVLAASLVLTSGSPVKVVVTNGTDLVSFQNVEGNLDTVDGYYFVPVTEDTTVHDWLKTKVESWSSPSGKKESVLVCGKSSSAVSKPDIIDDISTYAQSFGSKRVVVVWPDAITVPVFEPATGSSTTAEVGPVFLAALIAGHFARSTRAVYDPMTNETLDVIQNLRRSNDLFTEDELNQIASGGVLIVTKKGNLFTIRHALTTDMTQVETREIVITEIVDVIAKGLRAVLSPYIGMPISNELVAEIRMTTDMQLQYYVREGFLTSYQINAVEQDTNNPDTVKVDLSIKPTYPCNYINVVLNIG